MYYRWQHVLHRFKRSVNSCAGVVVVLSLTLVPHCYEGHCRSCSSSFLKYSTLNSASLFSVRCFIFSRSSFWDFSKLCLLFLSFSTRNSCTLFSLRNFIFSCASSCNSSNIFFPLSDSVLLLCDTRVILRTFVSELLPCGGTGTVGLHCWHPSG